MLSAGLTVGSRTLQEARALPCRDHKQRSWGKLGREHRAAGSPRRSEREHQAEWDGTGLESWAPGRPASEGTLRTSPVLVRRLLDALICLWLNTR